MYESSMAVRNSGLCPRMPGKPLATISSRYCAKLNCVAPWTSASPSRSDARLTEDSVTPRSYRAIGRMRSRTTRPAPVWVSVPGRGVALPVIRKRPGGAPASTARRTESQICGNRCHSSMSSVPAGADLNFGSDSSRASWSGSSSNQLALARRAAVTVLPTAFAPSMAIAGASGSSRSS